MLTTYMASIEIYDSKYYVAETQNEVICIPLRHDPAWVLSCQRFERPIDSFPCASHVLIGRPPQSPPDLGENPAPSAQCALVLLPATVYAGARGWTPLALVSGRVVGLLRPERASLERVCSACSNLTYGSISAGRKSRGFPVT